MYLVCSSLQHPECGQGGNHEVAPPDTIDGMCMCCNLDDQAQELASKTFGADKSWFLVNGTTGGIQVRALETYILWPCATKVIKPKRQKELYTSHKTIFIPCVSAPTKHVPETRYACRVRREFRVSSDMRLLFSFDRQASWQPAAQETT